MKRRAMKFNQQQTTKIMNTPKDSTATSERYKQELGNMARRRLTYPDHQAEAIAKHYAAHATIALQILKMVECRRHTGGYPELDRSIQILVDEIKNNHWHDFGIELEWPGARWTR